MMALSANNAENKGVLGQGARERRNSEMTPILTLERGAAAVSATEAPVKTEAARPAPCDLFVVATHKVRDRSGGAPNQWLPYGVEHAWAPGTRRTLCGEWTTGWTVFWDRHFSARPAAACPACVEATLPEASRRRLDHFTNDRRSASV